MLLSNDNVKLIYPQLTYKTHAFFFSYLAKSIPREISHGFHDFCWYPNMEKTERIETKHIYDSTQGQSAWWVCYYKLILSHLIHANVWESMGKPCSYMQFIKNVFFTTSHMRIRISTTSHMRICIGTTSHMRIRISTTSHMHCV